MDARISVTKPTRDLFRDLCNGLGLDYDEAIQYVVDKIKNDNEDAVITGYRLRADVDLWKAGKKMGNSQGKKSRNSKG